LSISTSLTGAGNLPIPTIMCTPGEIRTMISHGMFSIKSFCQTQLR
jgi:hypothetical protein